jgi:para-nitrobenzyl esterase
MAKYSAASGLVALGIGLGVAGMAAAQGTSGAVAIEGGNISGIWRDNAAVRAFLGVPFAAPPVGALRWQAPQPVVPWQGVRAADAYGAQCMQKARSHTSVYYQYAGTQPTAEDCLYLNVWAPAAERAHDLPVMVWLYGGGFQQGSAANPVFDGTALARRGVVVVTVNYRVGIFGFFAHPALAAESPAHASGNYGLLDQIAALRWVQHNIAAFGGNPGNVTLFGQSAGAASVDMLMASPPARGLFEHAIAESYGLDRHMPARAEAEARGTQLAAKLGADSLEALRAVPAAQLLDQGGAWWPIVDGAVLPEDVYTAFSQGREADVPLLTGWNADEGTTFPHAATRAAYENGLRQRFGDAAAGLHAIYPADDDAGATAASIRLFGEGRLAWGAWSAARLHVRNHFPTYVYFFDHPQPMLPGARFDETEGGIALGTFHSSEYPYIFGTLAVLSRAWTGADRALSREFGAYWTAFAATGTPNAVGLGFWPRFDGSAGSIMRLGDQGGPGPGPVVERLRALDALDAPQASN